MSSTESPASAAAPSATYNGACHCNKIKYTVTQSPPLTDPTAEVIDCNCSICSRNGYLFIYVPDKDVTFEKGTLDDLRKYTFAPRHKIAHYFCPTCGTSCFSKSTDPEYYPDYLAVNVRAFEELDLKALKLKQVDGKNYNG
ncbi:glutathione-dependent formaldehyde-activating protein [Lentithecium fluviatile CBS 122367]|uniref:Glutathione-dependent formaldehyde-activating protein n=1 Tax=Lentithecium fluviatile CBS 122367 TaxID=1168545 RepID=A0A6G1IM71_9PLEO|nr:glutathione-dependent formaldehyde-activating protein [Lentithecium fluviatile CBS 122367]